MQTLNQLLRDRGQGGRTFRVRLLLVSILGFCYSSDGILTFPAKPAFLPDSFVESATSGQTTFLCSPRENDPNLSSTTIQVQYFLPNGRSLSEGTSPDMKYHVITNYVPTTKSNSAQLIISKLGAEDAGTYTCVASISPTVNISATARLEVRGRTTENILDGYFQGTIFGIDIQLLILGIIGLVPIGVFLVTCLCCCRCYQKNRRRESKDERFFNGELNDSVREVEMPGYVLRNLLGRGVDICRFDPNDITTSITPSFLFEPNRSLVHITPQLEKHYSKHELTRQNTERLNSDLRGKLTKALTIDPVNIRLEISIGWGTSKTTGEGLTRSVEKIHKSTARFRSDVWECLPCALDENHALCGRRQGKIGAKLSTVVKCNKLQDKLDFYGTVGTSASKMQACEKLLENSQMRATHFISAVHLGAMIIHESSEKTQNKLKRRPSKITVESQTVSSTPNLGIAADANTDSGCDEEESKKDQVFFLDPRVELRGPNTVIEDGQERIIGYELRPITALAKQEWQKDLKTVFDKYIYRSLENQRGKKHDKNVIGSFLLKTGKHWLNVDEGLESVTPTQDETQASEFYFVRFETGEQRAPDPDVFTIQIRSGSEHKNQVRFLSLPSSKVSVKLEKTVNRHTSLFYLSHVDTEKPVSLAAEAVLDGRYLICHKETYWLVSWRYLFLATDTDNSGKTLVTGRYLRTGPDVHTQFLFIKPSGIADDQNATTMNAVQ